MTGSPCACAPRIRTRSRGTAIADGRVMRTSSILLFAAALGFGCSSVAEPSAQTAPGSVPDGGADDPDATAGAAGRAATGPEDAATEAPPAWNGDSADDAATSFFGASRCESAGVALCDGFESGTIDLAIWSVLAPPGNQVKIDDVRAARGKLSLHVSASNEAQTRAHIAQKQTFPAANNSFYGRAFVYLETIPINNFNLFAAKGSDGDFNLGGQVKPLGDPNGTSMIRFSTHPLHTSSLSATPVPSGSWDCWEWYFDGDGESELRAWLNEVALDDMTVIGGTSKGEWVAPEFDSLSFGLHHPHPEPAPSYEVWIDEIAVDAERIGCSR